MEKLKLFEYVVLQHPTEEEEKAGKKTSILIDYQRELAKDERSLTFKIAKKLPDESMDKLNNIEIIVRPF